MAFGADTAIELSAVSGAETFLVRKKLRYLGIINVYFLMYVPHIFPAKSLSI